VAGGNNAAQEVRWDAMNFEVARKGQSALKVLNDVSGAVPAGQLCAILGPSGAGKSSLLNALAGRIATGGNVKISGVMQVGGQAMDPVAFRQHIAYVMQDDAMMPCATPREALRFAASLRLPQGTTAATIEELVTQTLEDLGITGCADTLIGGEMVKGISGGQRKRTAVGCELICKPRLLFLDEPTSGLDSHNAFLLVKLLRKVASEGCTVLCTIHQPSSEVFQIFQRAVFLKSGRVAYEGETEGLTAHFSQAGFEIPAATNPADHAMFVLQSTEDTVLQRQGVLLSAAPEASARTQAFAAAPKLVVTSSFGKQLRMLASREFTATARNKPLLAGRFGVTIMLNLIFGAIFWGSGNRDDSISENFNSHFGAVTMISISRSVCGMTGRGRRASNAPATACCTWTL
jgi:ABC-type multidrug transport system ATPase subunit